METEAWQFGVLLYFIAYNARPFGSNETTLNKTLTLEYSFKEDYRQASDELKDLIGKLLQHSDKRLAFDSILQHPWFFMTPKMNLSKEIDTDTDL